MQNKTYICGGFTPSNIETLFDMAPYIKGFVTFALPTQTNIDNFKAHGVDYTKIIFAPNGKDITAGDEVTIRQASAQGYNVEMYYVDYNITKNELLNTLYDLTLLGINGIITDNFTFSDVVAGHIE